MTIGFTGTQRGMTKVQRETVKALLRDFAPDMVRHGMCIGADAEFHDLAREQRIYIIGHPGTTRYDEALNRATVVCDHTLDEKYFLDRNRDIVDGSALMLAAPSQWNEQVRSGTWSTIRYARRVCRRLVIVGPNGRADARFDNRL
jgi:hypothetical protein